MERLTESEAIKYGKDYLNDLCCAACKVEDKHKDFVRMAIRALEEIEQYRAIGTVEECRAADEKQRKMKMSEGYDNGHIRKCCGRCGCFVLPASKYCSKCGQKLGWSDE